MFAFRRLYRLGAISLCLGAAAALAAMRPDPDDPDPSFDMQAIVHDPLDARILKTEMDDGLRFETVEFTSQTVSGSPIRVSGVLALPEKAQRHPAVFFSMPGMAPASKTWSGTFARKGYVALTLTLPAAPLPPPPAYAGQILADGHLTAWAVAQMRGITYLTQRPEVDPHRIGIGGSSYGGFFATLIAGADPRIKAGMSFFAGGHQELGTHLPQFVGLPNRDQIELWSKTIDPAWRLRRRAVPFLWGVAANDHWFHFPSVIETARDSIGDTRLAILPHWDHGLTEALDRQLIDWFDTQLARPEDQGHPPVRRAYNPVGELIVARTVKGLNARWTVAGSNPVVQAEIIVSFGPDQPWQGWTHRLHSAFPVRLIPPLAPGTPWACETYLPVPHPDLPMLVYGNAVDDREVLCSTLPQKIIPREWGIDTPLDIPDLNAFPWGDFEPDQMEQWARCDVRPGIPDRAVFKNGRQSLRIDPPGKAPSSAPSTTLKLLHVPTLAHRLTGWIKIQTGESVVLQIQTLPCPPRPGEASAPAAASSASPVAFKTLTGHDAWQPFSLDCPRPSSPIEGYQLVARSAPHPVPFWLDEIRFEPIWPVFSKPTGTEVAP